MLWYDYSVLQVIGDRTIEVKNNKNTVIMNERIRSKEVRLIDENGDMAIYNQVAVGSADADGYTPTWLTYCSYGESGYTFVTGQFPAYTFAMDGDFADGTAYSGELSSGENFAVLSLELYALSSGIAFYVDDFPFECMAGHWSLARTASAPAQKTCASVKTIAEKQDVVRNDRFVMEYLAF